MRGEHAHEVEDRGVRVGAVGLEARALEDDEPLLSRARGEVADEAGFAAAGLAGDEQRAAMPLTGAVERVTRSGQSRGASDEGRTDDRLFNEHGSRFIVGARDSDRTAS